MEPIKNATELAERLESIYVQLGNLAGETEYMAARARDLRLRVQEMDKEKRQAFAEIAEFKKELNALQQAGVGDGARNASNNDAETFPATLEQCPICGGNDVRIVNITYHEDDAHAFYLCRRCRMLVEKSRYRRKRTDRYEESN